MPFWLSKKGIALVFAVVAIAACGGEKTALVPVTQPVPSSPKPAATAEPSPTPTAKPTVTSVPPTPNPSPPPSPTPTPTPSPTPQPTYTPTPPLPTPTPISIAKPVLTQAGWSLFQEVAVKSKDRGGYPGQDLITKWSYENPPVILVYATETEENKETISYLQNSVVKEARELTGLDIILNVEFVKSFDETNRYPDNVNYPFYIGFSRLTLSKLFPSLSEDEPALIKGSSQFGLDPYTSEIKWAIAAVSLIPPTQIKHAILHEFTHNLGLEFHPITYTDSVLYGGFSTVTEFSALDEMIIRALYHPLVKARMTVDDLERVIDIR